MSVFKEADEGAGGGGSEVSYGITIPHSATTTSAAGGLGLIFGSSLISTPPFPGDFGSHQGPFGGLGLGLGSKAEALGGLGWFNGGASPSSAVAHSSGLRQSRLGPGTLTFSSPAGGAGKEISGVKVCPRPANSNEAGGSPMAMAECS